MRNLSLLLALLVALTSPPKLQNRSPASPRPIHSASPYPPTKGHAPPAWFINIASQPGIPSATSTAARPQALIIEATGSGAAIIDYDRDG